MKFNSSAVIVSVVALLLAGKCSGASWYNNFSFNNNNNNQSRALDHRSGRFLFDALFGLDSSTFSLDDDGPDATNLVKSCDCGEWDELWHL